MSGINKSIPHKTLNLTYHVVTGYTVCCGCDPSEASAKLSITYCSFESKEKYDSSTDKHTAQFGGSTQPYLIPMEDIYDIDLTYLEDKLIQNVKVNISELKQGTKQA